VLRQLAADTLFVRGTALLQTGEAGRALWYLALAARLASSNAVYFGAAALAAYKAGDLDAGVRYAERALELDSELNSARDLLAAMFLHGETYLDVLKRLHQHLKPRTYLEIGVELGRSLALVQPATRAIGIDPQPLLTYELPPNVRLFKETSDEFFARRDVRAELGGLPIELAFIDGMHHFEYALRDFMNIERRCTPESTLVLDDCFPRDRRTAARQRTTTFWSGDVWKLVVLLKKYRPELSIHTIAAPPTGVCVVRGLDPSSRFVAENLQRLIDEFMALDYSYLEKDRAGKLNLLPNDWSRIQPLLGSARQL
jgi:tetratricopeptide (TPR) repeat protein